MTSLRIFQTEIEEIHHKELIKQRAQGTTGTISEKKKKEDRSPQSSKGKEKTRDTPDAESGGSSRDVQSGMVDVEEQILVQPWLMQVFGV
jgi:hypothetical protein